MENLVFKRLVVASDTLKSGNQFEFKPRFNLITANDNSVGKSTLAKLLFWALGGDPVLDVTWTGFDVRCLVDFSVGNQTYQAGRYGNIMFLRRPNGEWEKFPKITGAYSDAFAEIVGFEALLPSRSDSTKLETPPPAFYFLPFYVDQQRSWSHAWNGFTNLEQYAKWQKTIIEYHTGYLRPEFFTFEEKIAAQNLEKKTAEGEVRKIETAIDVVKTYVPQSRKMVTLSKGEFDILASEVSDDIAKLQAKQEDLLGTIAELQTERVYLQGQLDLAAIASSELDKDYTFSVECIEGESLLCPLCGTMHDNSSPSRASILADKDEAERQVMQINGKIERLNKELANSQKRLESTRTEIDEINSKYKSLEPSSMPENQENASEASFLDSIASRAVQKHVQRTMETKTALIRSINSTNRSLRAEQKKLLTKEQREDLNAAFKNSLTSYLQELNAQGVNLAPVESPLDYKKIHGSGGAAESTRGILAYYMSVIRQAHKAENEAFSAIVIDTPNQQEQADFNYEKILQFLTGAVPSNAQLILCAMNRDEIKDYKREAHVIELDEQKILKETNYTECRSLLNFDGSITGPSNNLPS
ncbi:TPA: hypothetical protein ACKPW9_005085 [Pseudomonas aeruginosa]|uniref:Rad50/SbcC-type AAA domain-containing protein n=3 Tax=Pseudomonadota TaxID=1224 RepID=A0A246KZC3_9GAMM|nr:MULTISPECIES: hypothetical protein [Pseudomonadota]ECD7395830.1 hypothetical protein [Salmonella enterica subsp. enterica serovar Westhampton]ECJ6241043.1 hypothetical protein [Salmonella enterica subsp. enterica]ERU45666.1 hypothetical protein Q093_00887 [Pseudomonas aeruginosa CF614]OWR33927.1 hypothetical protein CEE55_09380 [Stenotrophomonas pavanii]HAK1839139.1 hypothetical protein [Salmonella enterica]HEL3254822.1 hypothetical protein [Stenotrophomonas maltophilia]